jgi:signal transduction histidine kinase
MVKDKISPVSNHADERERRFLQPIAVGIACAVFITLILIMGIMDLRRSERSLVGLLENQGLAFIEVVRGLTQENLNLLQVQAQQRVNDKSFLPITNEVLSPRAWLASAIAELGKELDEQWQAGHLSNEVLRKFASEKDLLIVAIIDKKNLVVFQNKSLSPGLLPKNYFSENGPEISIDLLVELAKQKKTSLFALRRKDGSGTVIIVLDRDGSVYWAMKVSIQKAIEKLGEGQKQGLVYMVITDRRGMLLGSSGRRPENWKPGDMHTYELLAGTRKIESRKVIYLKNNILDIAAPLYINGKIAGIVRLGVDQGSTDIIFEENTHNLIFFMIFVVLITLLSMWLLYHNQNKHLAGIVEIERRLEKAERLSALGQLAAGVAHEIRNPLNAISMASQRLKREFIPVDDAKCHEFQLLSGVIRDEIRRLNGIIEEFLSFSKSRRLDLHDYSATDVLQKIVNLIGEEAASKGIVLKTKFGSNPIIIPMDMDKLQQALLNFVKNAMESISGDGTITMTIAQKERDRIGITISDTGCGMTNDEIERIFNPEYTTKEKGLGLGLALAHEIIRGHGGEIRVFSAPGKGTTFEILLPTERAAKRVNGNVSKGKEAS